MSVRSRALDSAVSVASNGTWFPLIISKFMASLMYLNVVWRLLAENFLSTKQWDSVAQDVRILYKRKAKMKFKNEPLH